VEADLSIELGSGYSIPGRIGISVRVESHRRLKQICPGFEDLHILPFTRNLCLKHP
jgi:hypothetical protein